MKEAVTPLAYVLLANPIRQEAKETFTYFAEQGVEVKVISGDNPLTVSRGGKRGGNRRRRTICGCVHASYGRGDAGSSPEQCSISPCHSEPEAEICADIEGRRKDCGHDRRWCQRCAGLKRCGLQYRYGIRK